MSSLEEAKKNVALENPDNVMSLKFMVSDQNTIDKLMSVSDLTQEVAGGHIIALIFQNILKGLDAAGFRNIQVIRKQPIVTAVDNFDNLLFTPGNPGRSSTYTRYVDEDHVLRTHTSALIPEIFREIAPTIATSESFRTLIIPGLVFRRDIIDPKHLDAFHQIDIWTLQEKAEWGEVDRNALLKLVNVVFSAACPDAEMVYYEAKHPYTVNGIEVYAKIEGREIEVLECGLIHPEVLRKAGLDDSKYTGLALGLGLERIIMARKQLPDIRLIRSKDPRIVRQMTNLEKYIPVSDKPAISRDLSYATYHRDTEEDICEEIKMAFGDKSDLIEEVILVQRIPHNDLHPKAQEKLGTNKELDNILVRIVLRHPDVTLTKEEANSLYKSAYPKIHKGSAAGYPN